MFEWGRDIVSGVRANCIQQLLDFVSQQDIVPKPKCSHFNTNIKQRLWSVNALLVVLSESNTWKVAATVSGNGYPLLNHMAQDGGERMQTSRKVVGSCKVTFQGTASRYDLRVKLYVRLYSNHIFLGKSSLIKISEGDFQVSYQCP